MLRHTDTRDQPGGSASLSSRHGRCPSSSQIRSGLHRRCGPAGMRAGRVCRQAAARCSTRTGRPEEGFPLLAPSPGTQPEDESRAYNCEIPASFFSFLDASAPKESTALVVLCTLKLCKKYTSTAHSILLSLMAGEVKAEKSSNSIDEL